MSDYPVEYEKPRLTNFWCDQDAKWHPKCKCKEQFFECGLIQTNENLTEF